MSRDAVDLSSPSEAPPAGRPSLAEPTLETAMIRPSHLLTLLLGFLMGVFIMIVLRSEVLRLRDLAGKLAVFLAISIGIAVPLYLLYLRLAQTLRAVFGAAQGAAILHAINFLLLGLATALFIVAGLYYVVLA